MKTVFNTIVTLISLLFCTSAFAQSSSLSGSVADSSGGLVPGVTVTATNNATGVVSSTVTNESGTYNFPSIQPGIYKASAALPGFQTKTITDIQIGASIQTRVNFTLQVGTVTSSLDVVVAGDAAITSSSASIGQVLSESKIQELPIVGGNALDLINTMAGIRLDGTFGESGPGVTFAGVSSLQINTVRDGLSVSDGRFNNGVFATTFLSPDLVGEIRVILTPVDAELGRGNGQVQVQTRSGTNRYAGSAVWNVRNTALNSNTWANNRTIDASTGQWKPTVPNWQNNHQVTLSYGGPIIKNKTFFFGLYDQQLNYRRNILTASVMTDQARNGIFRYFDGWGNGNAAASTVATGTAPARAVVDFQGNPLTSLITAFPNGTAYAAGQGLKCFSIFGNTKTDGTPFTAADCPGGTATTSAAPWDSLRPVTDSTGYIKKVLDLMPRANYFGNALTSVDGLNLAGYQYTVRRRGNGGGGSTTQGQSTDLDRKQFNLKIDHNLSQNHKINAGWSIENDNTASDISNWPGGLSFQTARHPQVFTVNGVSTLSPTLLNEARFGIRYTKEGVDAPFEISSMADEAKSWMLPGSNGYTALVSPGAGNFAFGGTANGIFSVNPGQYNGNTSKLYSYGDTVSWTRGAHGLKFGAELRFTSTAGYNNVAGGGVVFPPPTIQGGAGNNTSTLNTAGTAAAASSLLTANRANAVNMLYFLAGSVNNVQQLYWIDHQSDVTNGTWQDVTTAPNGRKYRNTIENEWSGFSKDDWKVTKNLTLNIGARYEFYGSPYIGSGLTATSVDQGDGLWGTFRTGGDNVYERWMSPGTVFLTGYGPNGTLTCALPACDPTKMTTVEFIGPKTTNPGKKAVPSDRNNLGPAVGFAYQLPWFGEGKTSLRGGYQITYGGSGRVVGGGFANTTEFIIGNPPGSASIANLSNYIQELNGQYLDLRNVASLVPAKPTNPAVPGGTLAMYSRANISAYDPHYVTPYTQNFTLSLTRSVSRNVSVDVRYVGTVSKKQDGEIPVNIDNIYHNRELFDALEAARRGQDPVLLDQMLAGLNINSTVSGYGPVGSLVNGVVQTGGAALRRNQAANLANGNYVAVADFLAGNGTGFPAGTGPGTLLATPAGLAGVQGRLLRNGCDRLANGQTTVGPANSTPLRCFSENYIFAVPQLGTGTGFAGSQIQTNTAYSNYHSMQAQVTLRPIHGFSYQATYTLSKNLGVPSGATAFTDPSDRRADYTYTSGDRKHDFRSNGTFELPIGPNKLLLGNSTGWLARVVERWQTSIIFNMTSGARANVVASNGLYALPVPDLVGPPVYASLLTTGQVRWNGNNNTAGNAHGGSFFNNPSPLVGVPDPQCQLTNVTDKMGFNLFTNGSCTINALALRNPDGTTGPIVFQNPLPGTRGNLGQNAALLPGTWNFDATASKTFKLSESWWLKSLQLRIDGTNILNHPLPNNPNLNLTSTTATFGEITTKGNQNRQFQGSLRLNF